MNASFFHLRIGSDDEWRQQLAALPQAFSTPRTTTIL